MNSIIKPVENTNYCILNDILKISISSALILARLKNIKSENFIFEDNLWYYQNYKTKTKLLDLILVEEINEIIFKNNDVNDYRLDNLDINYKDLNLNPPSGYIILEKGEATSIIEGAFAGQKRNMYWKVKKNEEKFYIMIIKENVYTKFSINDLNKVLNLNGTRPTWCLSSNGYISCRSKSYEDRKFCYLHQLIMNEHDKDNTDFKNTVDHINQDKLDNRRENLRIVNMSEQNKNKGKQTRRIDAKTELPDDIKVLPKYIEYRKEIYDKENNSQREFYIVNHPKLDKNWETTKSNKVLIQDKLKYAKAKLELVENKISEEQFKKIIGMEDKIDLPVGIRLEIFREKYHYILDMRNDDKRYNAKMILHSCDIQKELDKFINTVVNEKYSELKMQKYQIKNIVKIDEKLISVVEQIIESEKPTYPKHFSVYEEKGTTYIQYNKTTKEARYTKKHKITSNDIQKEVDKLVKDVNEKYPDYELCSEKQTVINPELFKLKEEPSSALKALDASVLFHKTEPEIIINNNIQKPDLSINFSICNINGIDYFQYCKKEDDNKNQKQKRINSYNIQEEFNDFVKIVNESFGLKLETKVINNQQNWKTTNKIIIKEETDYKIKNREKANKSIEKKKAEIGEEAFKTLKAQQAKERRKKNKEENKNIDI